MTYSTRFPLPFQPAPPARRATFLIRHVLSRSQISTRAPARRATRGRHPRHDPGRISTRAPRTEGDLNVSPYVSSRCYFNPRPPHGGRRCCIASITSGSRFQPAPPARRATNLLCPYLPVSGNFNPRPPHGGRPALPRRAQEGHGISTRAPRTEGDEQADGHRVRLMQFQPAPPARRATPRPARLSSSLNYFNPRPPHGGRPVDRRHRSGSLRISTRAPRTEGDTFRAGPR